MCFELETVEKYIYYLNNWYIFSSSKYVYLNIESILGFSFHFLKDMLITLTVHSKILRS